MKVLIYHDYVSDNGALYTALGKLHGKDNVFFVNATEILNGALDLKTKIFVMPGGAARYKDDKLNGEGYSLIKEYVRRGGSYLGVCAGAYSACAVTDWAAGTEHKLYHPNQLSLFSGRAVGPINEYAKANSLNDSDPRLVEVEFKGERVLALYWGGPRFVAHDDSAASVVATFCGLPDAPPAVVAGSFWDGRWLLTSAHHEYDAEAVDLINFHVQGNEYKKIKEIGDYSKLTLDFLKHILDSHLQ